MRKLLSYLKPYWLSTLLAPLLMILEVSMDLAQPTLMSRIVDIGIAKGDLEYVVSTGLTMLALSLIGMLGGVGCAVFSSIAAMNMGADLREELFRKVQSLSFGNLDRLETGNLTIRLTNDVVQVQEVTMMILRIMVRGPLLVVGSVILAVIISPQLSIILAVVAPLLILLLVVITGRAYPLFHRVQEKLERVNTRMQENLAGIRLVKAFTRSEFERQRFGKANNELLGVSVRAYRSVALIQPCILLLLNGGIVAVLWFGGLRVEAGTIAVGKVMAFINYLLQMTMSLVMVSTMLMRLSRAQASADRIREVLSMQPEIRDNGDAREVASLKGEVTFENVSFGYDGRMGEPVLRNISFHVEPGQTVALLGATGSGKSSLINLIPRLYDVTEGRILIDGVDIRLMTQESLRRSIGMVPQESTLFSGSIRSNLLYGRPDASEMEVESAARAAQAHEFVAGLQDGYDTDLSQKGVNLSGGQKQRLAIARALVMKPSILILDDAASAVDLKTESRLQASLRAVAGKATCFVVTQRVSSVREADRILVLEEGRVVAEGTHEELLRSSTIYRDIYNSQTGSSKIGAEEAIRG